MSSGKVTRSISLILVSVLIPFFSLSSSLQNSSAAANPALFHVNSTPGAHEAYVMPYGHLNITYADLKFILDQIKIGEAHAARTATSASTLENGSAPSGNIIYPYDITSANRCLIADDLLAAANKAGPTSLTDQYPFNAEYPWGVRQVDGQCNNIHGISAEPAPTQVYSAPITASDPAAWGAADQIFTRLAPATNKPSTPYALNDAQKAYQDPSKSVLDPTPREISNIISDQSAKNPAAVAAATQAASTLYQQSSPDSEFSINAGTGAVSTVLKIPNITADYNVSAGYNSWFTLFGQFFDHGLDLIPKAGATVLIPLMQDDPLYIPSPQAPNFMVLTRGAGASTGDSINTTTPYVDQSQTYGSHPSQNFFLREYKFASGTGYPTSSGRLLEGTDQKYTTPLPADWTTNPTVGGTLTSANGGTDIGNGGLATWREIKAQARLLGFNLTDYDARSIPVIATDQYGKFIPAANHFPMMLFTNGSSYVWQPGNPAAPIGTGAKTATDPLGNTSLPNQSGSNWHAVSTGHAFLNDTMASAVPFDMFGAPLSPDADSVMNSPNAIPVATYYDDETLNAHFISGDGRLNENIGLSAIHHVFHGEHNLVAQDITDLINNDPEVSAAFKSEWTGNGERLYQAARVVDEMEYQHMVYDEFIRRISPSLPVFSQYDPNLNADIPAEFASAVYRLGHSMLDETLARSNPGSFYDPTNNQDVNLITGFTNPAQSRLPRPMVVESATWSGSNFTFKMASGETAPQVGEIVSTSGMSFNIPTNTDSFNINSAVVASRTDTTFTVSTYYPGGSASGAVALPTAPSPQSSDSVLAPDGTTKVGSVAINDPLSSGFTYSPGASAASIAQGMSSQRGNEIDEFITDAVRNNLLGLPLDLASLNIARGRDVGVPTLNQFRKRYSASLTPYISWRDFISHLRYPESGVNFVAAYGNHPTLTSPVTIANISGATASAEANSKISISYTYTAPSGKQVKAGDVVTIAGLGAPYDVGDGIVSSATASSFVIKSEFAHAASAIISETTASKIYSDATPTLLTGSTGSKTGTATAKREPNIDEKRLAAAALVSSTMSVSSTYPSLPSVPTDATEFMTSTGAWASKESGLNDVDLWIGGLAENPAKQPITPPMLGTTFQFVFENVALKLQNGDRFYYLGRLMGHNLGEEIPAQKLTDIVRRNTPSASSAQSLSSAQGIIGMNSPGFSISDCSYSTTSSLVPAASSCAASTTRLDPNSGALIHDGLDNVTGFGDPTTLAGVKITGGGGDDSIFGSAGNDILSGGIGGDLIDGGVGDDIIFGGGGEDLIKGGPGNDVINPGDNQFGEIADGGSGDDYIHMGAATGFAVSIFGETGNDFIQGSNNLDIFLGGGEGDDWIEGSGDQENAMYGDNGPTFAAQQPTLGPGLFLGGNDVLNGGPGYDAMFGGGGDDIFFAGDGIDTMQGDGGFDWLNYEQDVRFDNGTTKRPSVFMDLSGTVVNPIASTTQDQVVDMEALSGSAGNDVLAGRNAGDVTVPSVVVPVGGNKGLLTLVLPGTVTGIDTGMKVTGAGVGTYASTVAAGVTSVVNGVTVTTVTVTDQNYANVTGPVTFSVWPLENPGLITNLTPMLSSTPGWTKNLVKNPAATTWTGGTILLGGDGNDTLYPIAGENVLHGSNYLHTCIKVNTPNFNNAGADVPCGGGLGYSGMSLLNTIMDSGAVNPADLSVVREILPTSVAITSYTADGNNIVYTAANNYYVGESVSISGITAGQYNLVNAIVTASTPNTFTVASRAPQVAATTPPAAARSVATDTVALPGTKDQYTIVPFLPSGGLPAGTTSAYKIISQDGRQDIIYDVQMVSFAGAPAVAISSSTPALTSLTVTPGTFAPAFSANTLNYTLVVNHLNPTTGAVADVTSATITPVAAAIGATISVKVGNGPQRSATSGQPFTVTGLSTTGPTTVNVIVTAADGITQTTYSIVVSHAGLVPIMQEHTTATTNSVVISVTNYDRNFTFTPTVTTTTPHNPGVPAVSVAAGTPNGLILPITVSNLLPNEAATVTVTATRVGFTDASATKSIGATVGGALIATFGNIVPTADGFTVQMNNYNSLYSLAITTSAGTVAQGTPAGSNLGLTVTGLTTGQTATVTVVATRTGYTDGTSSVIGNAIQGTGLVPTLGTPTGTSTGFTFNVANYDPTYSYAATTNNGTVLPGTPNGSSLPFTVSGISLGSSAIVTVTTTKSGSASGSSTVTGSANPLNSGGTITIVGTPTSASVGSHITLSTTGGTGSGAVTYTTSTGNCFLNGNLLTASGAATCSVTAIQAADSTHASVTSSPTNFVFAGSSTLTAQSALSLSGSAGSVTVRATITLSTTGGSSTGDVYYYTNTPGCSISGAILSATVAGTCSVMAIKLGDSTYAGVSSSLVSFIFSSSNLRSQAALSVSGSPTTTTVGSTITLNPVGGSGSGAVTFSTNSSAVCSITGNTLTAIAAGACVVVVTKDTDGTYAPTTGNATFNITNVINIGTFAFTNGVYSNVAGTSVIVIAAGGPGTGKIVYTASPSSCLIRGSVLTVTTAPVTCTVTATKAASAGSGALTLSQPFTFTVRPQALLRISNTVKTNLVHTAKVTITSLGGSGTGAIVYTVSGRGCSVAGATLSATGAGTCTVTATKAASSIYDVGTAVADFVFAS